MAFAACVQRLARHETAQASFLGTQTLPFTSHNACVYAQGSPMWRRGLAFLRDAMTGRYIYDQAVVHAARMAKRS